MHSASLRASASAVPGAPVLAGHAKVRQVDLRGLLVSDVRFPPGLFLPSHFHDTACLTVMLHGGMQERFPRRTLDCRPGLVLIKPWGERHDDRFSADGSRQLVIELAEDRARELPEAEALMSRVSLQRDGGARAIASRMTREFARPDGASRLVIESCALELMALLLPARAGDPRGVPGWLAAVRDQLRDDPWTDHSTRALAVAAGVHPAYLARRFRAHFGRSVGAYLRLVRIEWAAGQLRTTRRPLGELAHRARFADHSHFTREFKRHFGVPPSAYRERYS